ncbi:sigma factor [Dactylosporangium darangshiense]|uniref:RNA polymerase sigma-70 region 2 domain-containing protein n=1 Tax=Dactylosporangium darangshiense TaxID=579108 RepID=A0ABP8DBS7_9ACTN
MNAEASYQASDDWLARRFEEQPGQLRPVAYRMLGSLTEADDAAQETWLRLSRTNSGEIENLGGWLTSVVGRVRRTCCAPARPGARSTCPTRW